MPDTHPVYVADRESKIVALIQDEVPLEMVVRQKQAAHVVCLIARPGGFIGSSGDSEQGVNTICRSPRCCATPLRP